MHKKLSLHKPSIHLNDSNTESRPMGSMLDYLKDKVLKKDHPVNRYSRHIRSINNSHFLLDQFL
jgi:hypothetical protein